MQPATYIASTIAAINLFLYFVINELFCNSLSTLPCIAREALLEQTALNKTLHTEVSFQLFYSLSIMLSILNSFRKASGLPNIFIHASMGHTPFQIEWISYSW